MMQARYLSYPDAARYLGMSRSSLTRLVKGGQLPEPIRLGSMKRFDKEELDRKIHGDTRKAKADDAVANLVKNIENRKKETQRR